MNNFIQGIGNTPLIEIENSPQVFAKLEGQNLFGSAKDRAAYYIINKLLSDGIINNNTEIVESSSGNFAIALAGVCKFFNLKFTCVVDPLLNETNKKILNCYGVNLVCVDKPDKNNNYLKSRLNKVLEIISNNKKSYWINQYDNPLIPNAYKDISKEIFTQLKNVDYIFVPVSTCGTIAGISQYTKNNYPNVKIIAVDLDCSNIFDKAKTCQNIPGMGLFKKPGNLENAIIDDVVIVSEKDCIQECHLLANRGIIVGASSGGTFSAIKKYYGKFDKSDTIVALMPDRGERYLDSVFSEEWINIHYKQKR